MIGVFDSGLGGLTVAREIERQLPGRGIIYFGDTARTPYGTKSKSVVSAFAVQDAEFLVCHGAKVIVVACNTASALAMEAIRKRIRVPIFEVVTPAVAKAAAITGGRIGVIGTRATIKSGIYEREMRKLLPKVRVSAVACPMFVPLVEEGMLEHPATRAIANDYLRPLRSQHIDTLILGCTHYPFLRPTISKAIGAKVELVDPAKETAAALKYYLVAHPDLDRRLRRDQRRRFYVSDRTEHFAAIASKWLGRRITLKEARLE